MNLTPDWWMQLAMLIACYILGVKFPFNPRRAFGQKPRNPKP